MAYSSLSLHAFSQNRVQTAVTAIEKTLRQSKKNQKWELFVVVPTEFSAFDSCDVLVDGKLKQIVKNKHNDDDCVFLVGAFSFKQHAHHFNAAINHGGAGTLSDFVNQEVFQIVDPKGLD